MGDVCSFLLFAVFFFYKFAWLGDRYQVTSSSLHYYHHYYYYYYYLPQDQRKRASTLSHHRPRMLHQSKNGRTDTAHLLSLRACLKMMATRVLDKSYTHTQNMDYRSEPLCDRKEWGGVPSSLWLRWKLGLHSCVHAYTVHTRLCFDVCLKLSQINTFWSRIYLPYNWSECIGATTLPGNRRHLFIYWPRRVWQNPSDALLLASII